MNFNNTPRAYLLLTADLLVVKNLIVCSLSADLKLMYNSKTIAIINLNKKKDFESFDL